MNSYQELALVYDSLMNEIDYERWYQYILSLIDKYNINPKKVLEMGCGTGNFTKFLCNNPFELICFDISEDMLSVAFEKLVNNKNVTLLKQDMRTFRLGQKFDIVLSICDCINYITNTDDLDKVFSNVYEHLNDGGMFLFDISSYYKLSTIIGNNTFVYENDSIFYVWENNFEQGSSICDMYLTFFIKEDDRYKRFDESHTQKAYKIDDIIMRLKKANFSKIEKYHEFTFEAPIRTSERISFVATK